MYNFMDNGIVRLDLHNGEAFDLGRGSCVIYSAYGDSFWHRGIVSDQWDMISDLPNLKWKRDESA